MIEQIRIPIEGNPNNSKCKNIFNVPYNSEFWARVENRLELAYLLLKCINFVQTNYTDNNVSRNFDNFLILNSDNNFYIQLDKYTFDTNRKITSISSPFILKIEKISEKNEIIFIYQKQDNEIIIDTEMSNDILSILSEINLRDIYGTEDEEFLTILDTIEGYCNDYKKDSYNEYCTIIFFLLSSEILFTRIDIEEEANLTHPTVHIDFTTEKHSQFKIGLKRKIDSQEYINICDINKECYYIDH